MNDVIGISGLESAYEDQLRGQDGVETITRDSDGVIIDTSITTEPQPGKNGDADGEQRVPEGCGRSPGPQHPADRRHLQHRCQRRRGGGHRRQGRQHPGLLPTIPPTTKIFTAPSTVRTAPTPACPCTTAPCRACTPPGSTYKPSVAIAALLSGVIEPQQHRLLQRRLQLFQRLPPPLHPPRTQRRHRRGHRHQVELQHLLLRTWAAAPPARFTTSSPISWAWAPPPGWK